MKKADNQLISVIIAAYNIEAYLPRCMDSLLSQTYDNLELILVNDGSTDGTGKLCDYYAAKDVRVRVIHQENRGLSGARNAGLSIARGAYIGYVDGDDWVEPDMYKEMYRACKLQDAQVAVCAYKQVGNEKAEQSFTKEHYVLDREEALDIYLCDNRLFHIYNSVWSKLFQRELVEGMLFPEGKKSEDIMYTTKALANCRKCVFLDIPYYNYVIDRPGSIMNRGLHQRRFDDEIPFWEEQITYLAERGMELHAQKAAYHFYRRMLFYYLDFSERKMKNSCKELAELLENQKERIQEVYRQDFVATGDKMRMKLFLKNPKAYKSVAGLYEKVVVPLKQKE